MSDGVLRSASLPVAAARLAGGRGPGCRDRLVVLAAVLLLTGCAKHTFTVGGTGALVYDSLDECLYGRDTASPYDLASEAITPGVVYVIEPEVVITSRLERYGKDTVCYHVRIRGFSGWVAGYHGSLKRHP